MTGPTVSVIVVSRDRPSELHCCLTAISQLSYYPFEVIVVADRAGVAAAGGLAFADRLKIREFGEANISKARNLGLTLAAGEIVAFVDDDAVPEPGWLFHLTQPFSEQDVAAAGGFVRGRNGISFQWQGQVVNDQGYSSELGVDGDAAVVPFCPAGQAVKTQGTNCAFRRTEIAAIGGFDPAFRYYLDEADVNLRLAKLGLQTAIVPRAEVHHGFAASGIRHRSRLPKSLIEVGASQAVFLRKHYTGAVSDEVIVKFTQAHRQALLRHMVTGNCEPSDVDALLNTLKAGLVQGAKRETAPTLALQPSIEPFLAFRSTKDMPRHKVIAGYLVHAAGMREEAREAVRHGHVVSLYLFSRTALHHKVRYHDGYWEQTGGLWGRSVRTDPIIRKVSMERRVDNEINRVAWARDPLQTAARRLQNCKINV